MFAALIFRCLRFLLTTLRSADHYFWLRERESPKVLDYLTQEKLFHDQQTQETQALKDEIFGEFKGRLKETDSSAVFTRDQYQYYYRTEEGQV